MEDSIRLQVSGIPGCLSPTAVNELLTHFGAVQVTVHSRARSGTSRAVMEFHNAAAAQDAQRQLHGLALFGQTLSVTEHTKRDDKSCLDVKHMISRAGDDKETPKPDPIAPELGITYASNPDLEYAYPAANLETVSNIAATLLSVPRFYQQALHLMNKMNLPPPFTGVFPVVGDASAVGRTDPDLSSDESEMQSEDEVDMEPPLKRPRRTSLPLQIRLRRSIETASSTASPVRNVLSKEQCDRLRLTNEEILKNEQWAKAMKNYSAGEPCNVLFVKNVARQSTEADFYYILGRLFASDEATKSDLRVKIMKEGRMKGQAFLTFKNEAVAKRVLEEVHGYPLYGQPLVIQYGRRRVK